MVNMGVITECKKYTLLCGKVILTLAAPRDSSNLPPLRSCDEKWDGGRPLAALDRPLARSRPAGDYHVHSLSAPDLPRLVLSEPVLKHI